MCQGPSGGGTAFELALQRLEGRFLFVRGIYNAHSVSEDEVVFPALEEKHALKNVSQFYVLDHQQESELFEELASAIQDIQNMVRSDCSHATDLSVATMTTSAALPSMSRC